MGLLSGKENCIFLLKGIQTHHCAHGLWSGGQGPGEDVGRDDGSLCPCVFHVGVGVSPGESACKGHVSHPEMLYQLSLRA